MTLPTPDAREIAEAKPGFVQRRVARFQDVDAAGIVFFPRVLEYFHDAFAAFLDENGLPLAEVLRARAWAAPIRHAEADFLAPIRFGDALEVGLVRAAWDGSKLALWYRIAGKDGRVVAVGLTHHVFVDAASFERIAPPASVRAMFARLERA